MSMRTDSMLSGGQPCASSTVAMAVTVLASRPSTTVNIRRPRASAAGVMQTWLLACGVSSMASARTLLESAVSKARATQRRQMVSTRYAEMPTMRATAAKWPASTILIAIHPPRAIGLAATAPGAVAADAHARYLARIGQRHSLRCASIQAYFAAHPLQGTPSLFSRCRRASSAARTPRAAWTAPSARPSPAWRGRPRACPQPTPSPSCPASVRPAQLLGGHHDAHRLDMLGGLFLEPDRMLLLQHLLHLSSLHCRA